MEQREKVTSVEGDDKHGQYSGSVVSFFLSSVEILGASIEEEMAINGNSKEDQVDEENGKSVFNEAIGEVGDTVRLVRVRSEPSFAVLGEEMGLRILTKHCCRRPSSSR